MLLSSKKKLWDTEGPGIFRKFGTYIYDQITDKK